MTILSLVNNGRMAGVSFAGITIGLEKFDSPLKIGSPSEDQIRAFARSVFGHSPAHAEGLVASTRAFSLMNGATFFLASHELGHAVALRAFGASEVEVILALDGLTIPRSFERELTPREHVITLFAGPLAGMAVRTLVMVACASIYASIDAGHYESTAKQLSAMYGLMAVMSGIYELQYCIYNTAGEAGDFAKIERISPRFATAGKVALCGIFAFSLMASAYCMMSR